MLDFLELYRCGSINQLLPLSSPRDSRVPPASSAERSDRSIHPISRSGRSVAPLGPYPLFSRDPNETAPFLARLCRNERRRRWRDKMNSPCRGHDDDDDMKPLRGGGADGHGLE